jgi:hypothetical protein
MLKNWKTLLAAAMFAVLAFGAGAAFTAQAYAQSLAVRGEGGSARNIVLVKNRLERLIDELQRDRRDYGGHRVAAIADMQQARGELQAAITYDATHGH